MDEREKRDAEINAALAKLQIRPQKEDEKLDESMGDIVDLVQDIKVDNVKRLEIDERVDFAAQLEEIESKVTEDLIDHTEIDENELKLDPRMPKEGRERFLRARCRVLQEEVTRLQKELQAGNDKYHQERRRAEQSADQASKSAKQAEKQRRELDRLKIALDKETTKSSDAEKRSSQLKRELDEQRVKAKKTKATQNDVRLQRALTEVQKYKDELSDALRQRRDIGDAKKAELGDMEKEKNKAKKINVELKTIIQKQSKLIEVLRKKCAHLEAARVLEFTEEEFMKALDWQNN